MKPQHQEQTIAAEQAAHWIETMQSPEPRDTEEFRRWLLASPLNVQEALLASQMAALLDKGIDLERRVDLKKLIMEAKANANVLPIRARGSISPPAMALRKPRRWNLRVAASAALIMLLAALAWGLQLRDRNTYSTKRGDQRNFVLADGSVIYLNTLSRVQIRYSESSRDIYLKQGQALFDVKHDAVRPFRVHAAEAVIQALGTQFDVRLFADRTTVAVVEGSVQVSTTDGSGDSLLHSNTAAMGSPAKVVAGEAATIDARGTIAPAAHKDTGLIREWRRQRVVFDDTPLQEIASEFNRYNVAPQLRVADGEVGAKLYSGSFSARSPESLLAFLSQEGDLFFERRRDEVIIRAKLAVSATETSSGH
jgi:transmembrane sensor